MRSDIKEIVRIAAPLYLSMLAITAGALVNTAVLGTYGTVPLAAFAFANALLVIGQLLAFLRESKKAYAAEQQSPYRSPAVD